MVYYFEKEKKKKKKKDKYYYKEIYNMWRFCYRECTKEKNQI